MPQGCELTINHFYVYELRDGSLFLKVYFQSEVEVEFEWEDYVERDCATESSEWDLEEIGYYRRASPRTVRRHSWKTKTEMLYPEIEVVVEAHVKAGELANAEIVEWDFL